MADPLQQLVPLPLINDYFSPLAALRIPLVLFPYLRLPVLDGLSDTLLPLAQHALLLLEPEHFLPHALHLLLHEGVLLFHIV